MPHCGNKSLGKEKVYLGKKQRPTPGLVALFVKGLGLFPFGVFLKCSLCYLLEKILTYLQQKEASVWTELLILNYHIHFQNNYCMVCQAEVTER